MCSLYPPSETYPVWGPDPYLAKDINSLEMVQRRAAQWATPNYDWQSGISVSSTLSNYTLALRIQLSKLKFLYKAVHFSSGFKILDYYNRETSIPAAIN